jgi:hypothetical protein
MCVAQINYARALEQEYVKNVVRGDNERFLNDRKKANDQIDMNLINLAVKELRAIKVGDENKEFFNTAWNIVNQFNACPLPALLDFL